MVSPLVYLAAVFEVAVVKNIGEDESSLLIVHSFTACSAHAVIIEELSDVLILRLNREDLLILDIGALTGIEEYFVGVLYNGRKANKHGIHIFRREWRSRVRFQKEENF